MRSPRNTPLARAGFTLVELLVVISIIGILVGMLLPAIMAARERSRVTECKNNMHNLAVAIENYHTAQRMIPFSISPFADPSNTGEKNGRGWIVAILPQLEQTNLYKQIKMTGDFFSGGGIMDPDPQNRAAMAMVLPVLHCPADPDSKELSTSQAEWTGISVALTNYKGCIGDTEIGTQIGPPVVKLSSFYGTTPDCYNSSPCNGLFWPKSYLFPKRFDKFPDGASHTFLMGEDVPKYNNHSMWAYANGDFASCHVPLNYMPDPPNPTFFPDAISFRSMHRGGANFVFADGSGHWINDNISLDVYQALSTRDRKLNNKTEPVITDDAIQ